MDVYAWLLVAAMGLGVISNLYPFFSGLWIIFVSILVYGWFDTWVAYPVWYVVIVGVLAIGSSFLGRYGDKISAKFGTTGSSSLGNNIGTAIGNFLGRSYSGIIGGIFGAATLEYRNCQSVDNALRATAGSLIGDAVVSFIKLIISLIIFIVTFVLLWRAAI